MALYLCRDYLSQNISTGNRIYIPSYLMSIFLRRILGYTYVGDTNYPINSLGSLLISTGDTTPTVAPTFPVGNKAGIANNGAAIEVSIPLAVRGVNAADVGRILVLKSSSYPTRNAGIFLITAIQQGNATTVAAASNGQALPGTGNVISVASVVGFPTSGTLFIGASTTTTTVVALTGTFTLTVGSTTGFPTSGSLLVLSTTGTQTVTYTGTTATTFTGCTGGTGSTFVGGSITTTNGIQSVTYTGTTGTTPGTFTGTSGGTGTLITGEPVYNQNKYVIDYRGNGDLAQVEAADTVPWYLYDKDINCPTAGNSNGGAGYHGYGTSTTPRIILQSPNTLAWQVRICNEVGVDTGATVLTSVVTFTPGFGGNSAGDFPVGGQHLHMPLWYDTSDTNYMCGNGIGDNAGTGQQYRFTFIGDDTGQSFHGIARRPADATTPPSHYWCFGFPDNEPAPLPINNTDRLFVLGACVSNNTGNGRLNDVSIYSSFFQSGGIQGQSFHYAPISCSPSLWAYLTGNNQTSSIIYDASAGDSPFTSSTELVPIDLVAGTTHNWGTTTAASTIAMPYYPKIIGTLPIVKNGRTNFANYSLTTDTGSWTANAATNASPIQITTTASNTLVTGQTVVINGATGNTAANGTWVVTVINATQFTLNGSTGNGTFSGTASVLRGASIQHMRHGIYIPWNGPAVVP